MGMIILYADTKERNNMETGSTDAEPVELGSKSPLKVRLLSVGQLDMNGNVWSLASLRSMATLLPGQGYMKDNGDGERTQMGVVTKAWIEDDALWVEVEELPKE